MANVLDVARYILETKGETSAMKLHRLCYYSQAWALVWDDEPLFEEEFIAWETGPVCEELFVYTQHKSTIKSEDIPGNADKLNRKHRNTIDIVLEYYYPHEAYWLSRLSMMEKPWTTAHSNKQGDNVVTKESMAMYYGGL